MNDSKRDPANDVSDSERETVQAAPKKLLLGKRVIRAFGVRSGLRTGMCQDVTVTDGCGEDTDAGDSCGRSR